ncbi:MAG: glycosyltransferase, partial [Bacteroidaceae bacterium]
MTYSPIILFTYNRPEHTRRIITSLLQNSEAAKSELFIYSDAPKDASIQEAVEQVRTYIHSIKGFAQVNIVERKENWGLARNVIDGVTTIVNRFERVIVLEDDLVVAPYFLKFMNDALEMYKDEPR